MNYDQSNLTFGTLQLKTLNVVTATTGDSKVDKINISGSLGCGSLSTPAPVRNLFSAVTPLSYSSTTGLLSVPVGGGVVPSIISPDSVAATGTSSFLAQASHVHGVTGNVAPPDTAIGVTNEIGTAGSMARSDHAHKGLRFINISSVSVMNNISFPSTSSVSVTSTAPTTLCFSSTSSMPNFEMYALVETQPLGTNAGGYPTSGSYQSRFLNKMLFGLGTNVVLTSNGTTNTDFDLNPGDYFITARCPALGIRGHYIRLYNVTTSSAVAYGSSSRCSTEGSFNLNFIDSSIAKLSCNVTISDTTTFRIQHYGTSANSNSWAFGASAAFSGMTEELYSMVIITKF